MAPIKRRTIIGTTKFSEFWFEDIEVLLNFDN
ncbi:hypothetical protein AAA799O18_00015 [Marine Group I thaumarchaeote SCGC AAA799-O18]|nr:hypothetical protein AAA799O18_00015 [Marine Group I thaumarchaeote SCGC AAA799-O18]